MKVSRSIFYFFFTIYLILPDTAREIGIGPAGFRILFFDLFVISISLMTAVHFYESFRDLKEVVSLKALFIFGMLVFVSVLRGLPVYKGIAVGEARWYLCSILVLVGFAIYEENIIKNIKVIFYFSSLILSVVILFRYIFSIPWNIQDEAIRFGSGRESLIICIASLFLIYDIFLLGKVNKVRKVIMLCFLLLALLLAQTRTIFVIGPLMIVLVLIYLGKFRLKAIFKFASILIACAIILIFMIRLLLKPTILESVYTSTETLSEIFQPATYALILDPELLAVYASDFSPSGNTLWRAYAWGQTLEQINSTSLGWFIGLPMGSGYEFYSPGHVLISNLEPHNDYISIISKIGFIGLLGYLLILYSCFKNYIYYRKEIIMGEEKAELAIIIITIVFSLLLYSVVNDEIRSYGIYFWIWIFLGFAFRYIYEVKFSSTSD